MKPIFLTLLLCGTSSLIAAPNTPSPAMDAQASIQAIYNRQDAAIARHDQQGVLAGCAPDFHEVHTEKKAQGMSFTLAQLRPMIQSTLYFAKYAKRKTVIEDITFASGGVTVKVDQHMTLWMPVPKKHKYGQVIVDTKSADTWVKGKNGAWQDKQSLVLAGQTKVLLHKMPVSRK
jgi:hypothetical protein